MNAGNNEYETVDAATDIFKTVFTKKKKMASNLDNGVERRFVAVGVSEDLDVKTVNDAIDALSDIADDNVSIDSAGGMATKSLIPIFVADEVDSGVIDAVEGMDVMARKDVRVPVVAKVGSGGLTGSDVSLTYPIPPQRQLPRRCAVKKVVKSLCEIQRNRLNSLLLPNRFPQSGHDGGSRRIAMYRPLLYPL